MPDPKQPEETEEETPGSEYGGVGGEELLPDQPAEPEGTEEKKQ